MSIERLFTWQYIFILLLTSLGNNGLSGGKMVMKNGNGMMVHLGTIQTGPRMNQIMDQAASTAWNCGGINLAGMMMTDPSITGIFVNIREFTECEDNSLIQILC